MSRFSMSQGRSPGRKFDRTRRAAARRFLPLLELLESYQLLSAFTYTVTSSADTGNSATTPNDGTLRGAIEAANNIGVGNSATIDFAIPGSGVQTITVFANESLPTIVVPTILDGFTQVGVGSIGAPLIEINGITDPGGNGITLGGNLLTNASTSAIEGLAIVNFHEPGAASGSVVSGAGIDLPRQAGNVLIAGNYLGILPDGQSRVRPMTTESPFLRPATPSADRAEVSTT